MTEENKVAETVSADEKVDGASVAGSAGVTPSPKRGRRKVTAVVATVAVVLVAAGAGFMVWHDSPSFCNAICHTPRRASHAWVATCRRCPSRSPRVLAG